MIHPIIMQSYVRTMAKFAAEEEMALAQPEAPTEGLAEQLQGPPVGDGSSAGELDPQVLAELEQLGILSTNPATGELVIANEEALQQYFNDAGGGAAAQAPDVV